jgi:hypothetical protein
MNCAYDFSQPIIAGGREDFMGVPYKFLGDWTFTATSELARLRHAERVPLQHRGGRAHAAARRGAGRLPRRDPGPAVRLGDRSLRHPGAAERVFNAIGCALDGSIPLSNVSRPCPIDYDRTMQLPDGPPRDQLARRDLGRPARYAAADLRAGQASWLEEGSGQGNPERHLRAVRDTAAGSFLESYPTGVVTRWKRSTVRVLDTTAPVMQFSAIRRW